MAINTNKCDQCEHFDPVLRGTKNTPWGWCAKLSDYPATAGPGQIHPTGVKHVTAGEPAKPFIVRRGQIVENCTLFLARRQQASKADLVNKLLTKNGKVVLK
jgi:hypothetical protein